MEPTFNTSFIPKHAQGLSSQGVLPPEKRVRRRAVYGFGFFLALLTFFLSGLSAIGVFVYTQMVQQNVERGIDEVASLSEQLRPETIQALIRDDARLKETKRLLVNHRVVSSLLEELETVTLQEVQYVSASYNNNEEGRSTLTLDGITRDYTRVAGQTKRFEGHGSFPVPVVTRLERGEGSVSFTVSMQVDPVLVRFGKAIERGIYQTVGAVPATAVVDDEKVLLPQTGAASVVATGTVPAAVEMEATATSGAETVSE